MKNLIILALATFMVSQAHAMCAPQEMAEKFATEKSLNILMGTGNIKDEASAALQLNVAPIANEDGDRDDVAFDIAIKTAAAPDFSGEIKIVVNSPTCDIMQAESVGRSFIPIRTAADSDN